MKKDETRARARGGQHDGRTAEGLLVAAEPHRIHQGADPADRGADHVRERKAHEPRAGRRGQPGHGRRRGRAPGGTEGTPDGGGAAAGGPAAGGGAVAGYPAAQSGGHPAGAVRGRDELAHGGAETALQRRTLQER